MCADWQDALRSLLPEDYEPEQSAAEAEEKPRQRGPLRVSVDRRSNKVATIITEFTIADEDIDALAKELKRKLATGGSARGGEILLQGDRVAVVADLLRNMGYKVKEIR